MDPRIIKDAQLIPELSFEEMHHLARFGAKILYPSMLSPCIRAGIPIFVTSTFDITKGGSRIYAADKTDPLRGYDSSKMIESMMNNYLVGFKYVLNENKLFLINKTHDLSSIENRLSKACFEYYLEKK